MKDQIKSIRTFIGAKDFETSRGFYREWGFEENEIGKDLSYFYLNNIGFYLQDYYVKNWISNTMAFLEIDNLDEYWKELRGKKLDKRFKNVKYIDPKEFEWGSEGFVYDPSGILWHVGSFKN